MGCSLVLLLYSVLRASIFVKDLFNLCFGLKHYEGELCRLRSFNHNVYLLFTKTLTDPRSSTFSSEIFGLSVSDHGIVRLDIWPKCKLYCVPSLLSIIEGWDILFSVFCFSIYFLKAWFLVEEVGFLVIIFSARKWRERRILHHLPQSFGGRSWPPDPLP